MMNKYLLFAVFYALVHRPEGDSLEVFSGMKEETVRALIAERGLRFEFIEEESYRELIADSIKSQKEADAARAEKIKKDAQDAAIEAKDSGKGINARIDALIKLIDLK